MTFPIGLHLGLGRHAEPQGEKPGPGQPAFDPRRGAPATPAPDARPPRAADRPEPGPQAGGADGGGLGLGLKADLRNGLDVGLGVQLGPLADLGLRLKLGGGEKGARADHPDAGPRGDGRRLPSPDRPKPEAGRAPPRDPTGQGPTPQDRPGRGETPNAARGPNDGPAAGGRPAGPAPRPAPPGPHGPDPARPGSQAPPGRADAPPARDRPTPGMAARDRPPGRADEDAAGRGPMEAPRPGAPQRQAPTEGRAPGNGPPPEVAAGRGVPEPQRPDPAGGPPARPQDGAPPAIPPRTEAPRAAARRDDEALPVRTVPRNAEAAPVRAAPNAGTPPAEALHAAAARATADSAIPRAADLRPEAFPPRVDAAPADAPVRTPAPAAAAVTEAAPSAADLRRERAEAGRIEQGRAEQAQTDAAAVNAGRPAQAAATGAAQRETASDPEPAPRPGSIGLAAPASPGAVRAAEPIASSVAWPAGGGPVRGEVALTNVAAAQPGTVSAVQADVPALAHTGAAAAPLAGPVMTPAAPGSRIDASGSATAGVGPLGGAGSSVAPTGGSGIGAPLPLFNPFLTRRSKRDARRQAGLPARTGGLWAILRVLGWRRRRRGQAEPAAVPADEDAATLRAWRAVLGRQAGG